MAAPQVGVQTGVQLARFRRPISGLNVVRPASQTDALTHLRGCGPHRQTARVSDRWLLFLGCLALHDRCTRILNGVSKFPPRITEDCVPVPIEYGNLIPATKCPLAAFVVEDTMLVSMLIDRKCDCLQRLRRIPTAWNLPYVEQAAQAFPQFNR